MVFARRLKATRKARGLTQKELANRLGLTQSAVTGWEVGKSEPEYKNLLALARLLDVSIDYLLGHEGGEAPAPDMADAIGEIVETVEKGSATVDGAALAPAAADVAAPMLRGTLAATRSAQRDARRNAEKGGE